MQRREVILHYSFLFRLFVLKVAERGIAAYNQVVI